MNNTRIVVSSFLATAVLVLIVMNCAEEREKYNLYRERQHIEDNTPAFDPLYFTDSQHRHLALYLEIEDGDLSLANRKAELRPGNMPYHPMKSGAFVIKYISNDGTELGRYAIEDIRYLRSCSELNDNIKPIITGTIEVLLPADYRIDSVSFYPPHADSLSFYVGDKIKIAIDEGHI